MQYIARTTAGLEEITWLDISDQIEAEQSFLGHRQIHFYYGGHPKRLLYLRSLDDIYIYLSTLQQIDHTRASLAKIRRQIAQLNFDEALRPIQRVRPLAKSPLFHVTASYLGKRNYSRYDIRDAVRAGLAQNYSWTFTEEAGQAAIDVRVLVEATKAVVGIRLGASPLHRRSYKVCNLPGSLKPSVAYCLGLLATIQPGDTVVDPMCGAGTIGLEVAHTLDEGLVMNSDLSEEAIRCGQRNWAKSDTHLEPQFYLADAANLPVPANFSGKIITNLPWGRQVEVNRELDRLYRLTLKEIHRVLRSGGRAVLLTDQAELLAKARESLAGIRLVFAKQISLYGAYPTIHVLHKGPLPAERFPTTSPLGRKLNELVKREGVWQRYRPKR